MTEPQAVYKLAQLDGIIPLSGTTNEIHMREDVAVDDLSLEGEGWDEDLETVRSFVRG